MFSFTARVYSATAATVTANRNATTVTAAKIRTATTITTAIFRHSTTIYLPLGILHSGTGSELREATRRCRGKFEAEVILKHSPREWCVAFSTCFLRPVLWTGKGKLLPRCQNGLRRQMRSFYERSAAAEASS